MGLGPNFKLIGPHRPRTANAAHAKPKVVVVAVVLPASTSLGEA